MRLNQDGWPPEWQGTHADRHVGHAHFWERALTRRQFLGTTAVAGGAAATAALWTPLLAQAASGTPKPIPGGTQLPSPPFRANTIFHFYFPTKKPFTPFNVEDGTGDPSLIFDFHGNVAVAELSGTGTGTNTSSGKETAMTWEADVRAMKGKFVSTDGQTHRGAFCFI